MKNTAYLLLFLLLTGAGCQTTSNGPLTWTGTAPEPREQPAEPSPNEEPRDTRTPPSSERDVPTLELIDQSPRPSGGGLPTNLTGKNKPDGIALRYRKEVPTNTPGFVRREYDGLDLFIADAIPEGWLAFYKGNCGSLGDVCDYRAIFYNDDRTQRWDLNLNRYLQQERYVEIQDVRYHDGQLFFNEACATYASEVQGQCSWLVSVDPTFQEENWRTPPMTSNNVFILHDRSIYAGYGFTAEPDALYRIDARSGEILARADLDSAHEYLEVQGDKLYVVTYRSIYTFAL